MSGDLPRPAAREDVDAIGGIVEATDMFPAAMLEEMMAPFFAGADDELWFVIGQPARGVAYAVPEKLTNGTWNQLLIAVDPTQQGTGLGAVLMANLETVVTQRGGRMVIVETSGTPGFAGTRDFYRAIGYQEEGRIRDFYDEGDDKVVFRKKVAA